MAKINCYVQMRAYFDECTVSDLVTPDGENIGYCLEGIGRPDGIKIQGKTCIPEGVYDVSITYSNKYGKPMILLSNSPQGIVSRMGISFSGLRVHVYIKIKVDSEGCVLVAKNFDGDHTIWESLSKQITQDVTEMLDRGELVKWIITRK